MIRQTGFSIVAACIGGLACADTALWAASPRADAPSSLVQQSDEALQQAFRGNEFWWKRTARVDDPDLPWLLAVSHWLGQVITDALNALGNLLDWLADWLFGNLGLGGIGDVGDWSGIAWMVIALAVAFLLWKGRGLIRSWFRGAAGAQDVSQPAQQQTLPDFEILLEQAREALRAQRHSDAIRCAFLALLAALQHRQLLRYDPSRTNREYYHDLRSEPEVARTFLEAARPFERAWYGKQDASEKEAEQVLALCRRAIDPQGVAG